jgi:glycosyltransferase involved in cell wall biosynthesis
MACGTPVVAVREGGILETVLHRKTGLLIERDGPQFATAIEQLLNDPHLAAEYGREGREYVLRQWTWRSLITILESQFAACLTPKVDERRPSTQIGTIEQRL